MKIRMFISIPVTDTSAIEPLGKELKVISNVRPSPLSQMHITLRFIGDIDDSKTKKVARCVADAASGIPPFEITIGGAGCFPNVKRPSVIWVGAEPGDVLADLSDRISENFKSANIRFDEKPFKSHITIGRCTGPADVGGFLDRHKGQALQTFLCDGICIMRSELGPSGAKHTVLERIPLQPVD